MPKKIPRLLAISDGLSLEPWEPTAAWLDALAACGVDALQLREKNLDDRDLLALARRVRGHLPREVTVLVNGRIDIALAADCQGVHLPADGVPVAALRRRFGSEVVIGRSTHAPSEIAEAQRDGADYATFGPIFSTPSKRGFGPPPGLEGLRRAAALGLPVIALGGVGPEELPEVAAAGAAGAAGIRAFHQRASLEALTAASRRAWRG